MQDVFKTKVVQALNDFIKTKGISAAKAAVELGVSDGYLSNIRSGKWNAIADKTWRKLGKRLKVDGDVWNIYETAGLKLAKELLYDAKENSIVHSLIANPGGSKTTACEYMANKYKDAYWIKCEEHWSPLIFLQVLAQRMGLKAEGYNQNNLLNLITIKLKEDVEPIIIIDEINRLHDKVLYFTITLYNRLVDDCAIVTFATDEFEKRMKRGLALNRRGYQEIHSRLGGIYIHLTPVSYNDVRGVCSVNGIVDESTVNMIADYCGGDIRRARRKIESLFRKEKITAE